ncbi:MAG: NADPH-dependent glutamate synthase [Erysipelotrichales bacterium]|nr:NADPH-dependent glutamate synthase [Erysipelotrichales bacterium]
MAFNLSLTKLPMPTQDPQERIKNLKEVSTGYTVEMAQEEAQRCLNCKNPRCVEGCPVNVHIPEFIEQIKLGNFKEANAIIKQTNALPAICGRVCPQESQCESKCVRGIKGEPVGIGRLERFVADYAMEHKEGPAEKVPTNGHKVAVVGSGPSGLTCAKDLAMKGYEVTVFEALHTAGGVLVYGIPEFRLPKELVKKEIETIQEMGVKIVTNRVIGKSITIDELMEEEGYEAVYVASGAGLPKWQGIEGENLLGVYSANEFLTRINLMKAYKFPEYATPVRVGKAAAIIGGGNVAMDAARCAKRMGAEDTYIIYRRGLEEMPAREEEIHHAMEEGIIFKFLTNPTKIVGNDKKRVTGIECISMQLGEPDASGRRRPVPIEGSEEIIPVDSVIVAIGNNPNPLIPQSTPDLAIQKWGGIITDENGKTNLEGVYAGGDAVTGAATVILAMGAGKKAAASIDEYLKNKS